MSPPIEAVTLDFYHTLVRHRSGEGGRGRELIAYLTSQGLTPDPWQHEMLYRIMEPHAREYSPDATEAAKRRYLAGMARRAFECLGVVCPQGVVERRRRRVLAPPSALRVATSPTAARQGESISGTIDSNRHKSYRAIHKIFALIQNGTTKNGKRALHH